MQMSHLPQKTETDISGFHSDDDDYYCRLGYDDVSFHR
jgi:hypothetical protein